MGNPLGPTPDLDPYFAPVNHPPKGSTKGSPPGEEEIRRDLLPTETAFRVAGTIAMVLGASVFVLFAVPVSGTLREAGEPGGVLLGEDWLWRRWVARMASVLTLAVSASVIGWGLRRRRRWARWALIVLGVVPTMALAVGIGSRAAGPETALPGPDDLLRIPIQCLVIFAAGIATYCAACSRRGRAVFDPRYEGVVTRTQKLSPSVMRGLLPGLGLASAMLILCWTILTMFLSVIAEIGVIRSL